MGIRSKESFVEESLEETNETATVASFVFSHFMNGVMDGVITKFLGASGEFELASASARFSFSAHLEVGCGVGGDDFAE